MRKELIDLGLWPQTERSDPAADIEAAWKVMARLGSPCRYAGCGSDGLLECLVSEPGSGVVMAVGRGDTLPAAICRAAVLAKKSAGTKVPAP